MARKMKYTPELGDKICEMIAEGNSARQTMKSLGLSIRSLYHWRRDNPDFAQALEIAREDYADSLADELCEIAENEPDVQRAKLKIDARKWVAARMKPKSWGDRQALEHSGPGGGPIPIRNATELTDDQLAAIAATGCD